MKKVNIITLLLVFIIILSLLPTTAMASTITYSNVIDDLREADNFSEEYYPVKADDYSLSVIQIAESKDYELFVYVYQAGGQAFSVTASSINISTSINDNIKYHNYGLHLVSSSGTLFKYLVNDITVKADNTRYYAISSIYRPFEADVYYTYQSYHLFSSSVFREFYGDIQSTEVSLTYSDRGNYTGEGWFGGTYVWNRIETVDQFISENNLTQNVYTGALFDVNVENTLTDDAIDVLSNMTWVLRFVETSYGTQFFTDSIDTWKTIVGNVTILRLKFETDGVVYNLGVLDNKQSGSKDPANNEGVVIKPSDNLLSLLNLILMLVVLFAILYIMQPILPIILDGVMWIVSLPFKLIGSLFKGTKKASKRKYKRK